MEDELLKDMWLNVIEIYSLLVDKNSQIKLKNLNEKLGPILESYFIIYQIMFDNDYENEILLKKIKTQKQKKNISALQLEKLESVGKNSIGDNFETLRQNQFSDEKEVFSFLAR